MLINQSLAVCADPTKVQDTNVGIIQVNLNAQAFGTIHQNTGDILLSKLKHEVSQAVGSGDIKGNALIALFDSSQLAIALSPSDAGVHIPILETLSIAGAIALLNQHCLVQGDPQGSELPTSLKMA